MNKIEELAVKINNESEFESNINKIIKDYDKKLIKALNQCRALMKGYVHKSSNHLNQIQRDFILRLHTAVSKKLNLSYVA